MAPATPPRPRLSKARDRTERNHPEPTGSDDEVGCKRPRLVLPAPTADEGATPRHHLPFLDPAADDGALVPGVQNFPSGPGGEERGSRGQAQNREEVGKNGEKEVSLEHAQGREEGALSPNLSIIHLNADEGADAVVHNNSSGRGGCYGKGGKLENGQEGSRPQAQEEISKNEEILEKFVNGQEGSRSQAQEEISKNEEVLEKFENGQEGSRPQAQEISKNLEKFENSEVGSRLHAQVSKNEAILYLEKKQTKEYLPHPLESLEYALIDQFEEMHVMYRSIALLKEELRFGPVNLTPARREGLVHAWRSIKDRLPTCRALIRRIREANGPSYSVPDIFLE